MYVIDTGHIALLQKLIMKPSEQKKGWHIAKPIWDWLRIPPRYFVISIIVLVLSILLPLMFFGFGALFVFAYDMFEGKLTDRLEAAKVFFPVLVAIIGGPVLIWRAITAHWSAQAARQQASTDREGYYTGLFTKAVEQLGSTRDETSVDGKTITRPNLEVRLGAIYGLERIAQDSERDHWPIMEVLSAYVRNVQNTGTFVDEPTGKDVFDVEYDWDQKIISRVDIQSAITIIGQRANSRREHERKRKLRLNFAGANLQKIIFDEGNFDDAIFQNCQLDFSSFKNTSIKNSTFEDASLNYTKFHHAAMQAVVLSFVSARGTDFSNADLESADMTFADFTSCIFDETHFKKSASGAYFIESSFFNVDLSEVKGMSDENFKKNLGDSSTLLPNYFKRPANWPDYELKHIEKFEWREGKEPKKTK